VIDATAVPAEPVVAPATAAPEVAPAAPSVPFEFTGRAGEYFRIWIVNLFLTVLTLGIYSAWAKARRRRYFYGHTWVAGSNFEYHGNPLANLRGRLIAVFLFLAYTLLGNFSPRLAAAAALVALPVVPWLLLRSFKFNAVNTSYRNVRFGFDGSYRQLLTAILPVVIFPLVTVVFGRYDPNGQVKPTTAELAALLLPSFVFLLAYPWMAGRLHLIRVNGSRFGAAGFRCSAKIGEFYALYVIAGLIGFVMLVALFIPVGFLAAMRQVQLALVLGVLAYVAFFSFILSYTQSRVANLVYGSTRLNGTVSLKSRLKARRLAWAYATNLLLVLVTLGFAIPWAAVRVARIRAEALQLEAPGGLDHFVAGVTANVGATGEEVGELFAFDVAL
jgi:uncharacterized membrane protein YjgN (DUF898 family)